LAFTITFVPIAAAMIEKSFPSVNEEYQMRLYLAGQVSILKAKDWIPGIVCG
jgi:hypothetical protein